MQSEPGLTRVKNMLDAGGPVDIDQALILCNQVFTDKIGARGDVAFVKLYGELLLEKDDEEGALVMLELAVAGLERGMRRMQVEARAGKFILLLSDYI